MNAKRNPLPTVEQEKETALPELVSNNVKGEAFVSSLSIEDCVATMKYKLFDISWYEQDFVFL